MSIIKSLRQLLAPRPAALHPALAAGERVYAVGDIHGRTDLFAALIDAIEADDTRRQIGTPTAPPTPTQTTVILLGDLIDRGPDSIGVLRMAREWQARRPVRILCGNHEEMLLGALDNIEILRGFLRLGGRETVLSCGISTDAYASASFEAVQDVLKAGLGADLLEFIRSFEDQIRVGDYVFVHAGVKPGVPLDDQKTNDLRWIREPFLRSTADHGAVVVHGHTIADAVVVRPNHIGVDTGAYASGCLTAIGLQGTDRWLIQTRHEDHGISTHLQSAA